LLVVIDYQLSTINYQLSTINYQLSTINYKNAAHLMKTIIFAATKKHSKVMKKGYFLFIMAAYWFMISCSQTTGTSENAINGAAIQFETTEHDYGTIPEKGDGTFTFIFKNTGKEPLILSNVRSSCGCTVPEWPKEPIKRGNKGTIKVSYNTRITGSFSKSITVYSNAEGDPVVLRIKGKVEPAAN
jgi:hypothetical protein